MKYNYIAICAIILLLIGCVPEEIPEEPEEIEPTPQQEEQPEEIPEEQPEEIHYDDEEDIGTDLEEELQPEQEPIEPSEEEELKKIFSSAKTKINSYSYRYNSPTGKQYNIYVKENKIRISSLSEDNKIYIDTEKKIAEEYCISKTKCGREWGKIADLDYYNAYIETPLDWLDKITETEKIDEGVYYGKQAWNLNTNIGEIIIDSNFGFIYSIKQEDKTYIFSNAKFNIVQDSEVNIPEYLIEG